MICLNHNRGKRLLCNQNKSQSLLWNQNKSQRLLWSQNRSQRLLWSQNRSQRLLWNQNKSQRLLRSQNQNKSQHCLLFHHLHLKNHHHFQIIHLAHQNLQIYLAINLDNYFSAKSAISPSDRYGTFADGTC